jgi:D-methionine transport system substrate-binding protein
MNVKKWICMSLVPAAVIGLLGGCGNTAGGGASSEGTKTVKVGTLSGPHSEVLEEVKKAAASKGLNVEIVEFNDYVQPNETLNNGEIDANMYQHLPFLQNHIKDRGYKLSSMGTTILFPMGVYSTKIKSVDEIRDHMTVAIPNDPSNGARGLELLDKAGVIKLNKEKNGKASVTDIVENPHQLVFKEVDAAMIPRMLPDLDFAAINNSYAAKSGLVPTRDAFILEGADSPYANILAVRTADLDRPELKLLMECFRSPEVKQFIQDHFKGAAVAAW